MLIKLNNRLVDRRISRNWTFLLVFSKVHEILSLKQSSVLGACRCSWLQGSSKLLASFSTKNIHKVAKMDIRWKCKQLGTPATSEHLQASKIVDCFRLRISWTFEKPIKKLNFDWYRGEPVGYLIWKTLSLHLDHQLVRMTRTGLSLILTSIWNYNRFYLPTRWSNQVTEKIFEISVAGLPRKMGDNI